MAKATSHAHPGRESGCGEQTDTRSGRHEIGTETLRNDVLPKVQLYGRREYKRNFHLHINHSQINKAACVVRFVGQAVAEVNIRIRRIGAQYALVADEYTTY